MRTATSPPQHAGATSVPKLDFSGDLRGTVGRLAEELFSSKPAHVLD
jgi:hypothetical protein